MMKRYLTMAVLALAALARAHGVDPILHYTFDDGVDPTSNLGTLGPMYDGAIGAGIEFAPLGGGLALEFDSVDDAQAQPLGDENAFDLADSDFSVAATVITTNDEPGAPGGRFVVTKETVGSEDGWGLQVRRDAGEAVFWISADGVSVVAGSLPAVNDGAAHELIGARAGGLLLLAVDGAVEAVTEIPAGFGSTAQNDNELSIGGRGRFAGGPTSGPNDEFLGTIDDVLIYDVAIIEAPCYADCDGSGGLDFFDFLCFQNAFATGDPYADCDATGVRDFFDFLCFQNEFAAGCP
ncbi:MAG: LamG-like jellyroll fold domain-containing protein [Phycisphaerales bacterium JB039]